VMRAVRGHHHYRSARASCRRARRLQSQAVPPRLD
jgi:hypothetical protein